jgi:hypothetical protein
LWLVALVGAGLAGSLLLGPLLGVAAVLALAAGLGIALRAGVLGGAASLTRGSAAASMLLVSGLGCFLLAVLVANRSDNAYLWIALLGMLLVVAGLPFGLAAVAPFEGLRRSLTRVGLVLVWGIGAPGLLLLLIGGPLYLVSTPGAFPGGAVDGRVVLNHVVGSVLLLIVLWIVGYYWPTRGVVPARSGAGDVLV